MVGESAPMQAVFGMIAKVAPTDATVLIQGESGAGKELIARAIHAGSRRSGKAFLAINCATLSETLIESELFGHERGAYADALARQLGRFEAADQSTLFLDEIGELSPEVQVKLLRVLQERVIERLGSTKPVKVDVRIIAATNRNLEQAVCEGAFREDLYYRLNVFPITIPPLRERVEDIPPLAWQFVREFSHSIRKPIDSVSNESLRQLQLYHWPGNVRELRNVIERAVILARGPELTIPLPQPLLVRQPQSASTLKDLQIEHIRATLQITNWRVRGVGGAAERLGMKPTTLETRMAKLGVTRPEQR
jgi:transcriptional regulator with GAF, ATPase, and Fis domain